jgi:hypothetical protein
MPCGAAALLALLLTLVVMAPSSSYYHRPSWPAASTHLQRWGIRMASSGAGPGSGPATSSGSPSIRQAGSTNGDAQLMTANPTNQLTSLLENMPLAEKYSLLLKSYASNIIDNSNRNATTLSTMESLFNEMVQKAIVPDIAASQSLIDAASTFCSSAKMGGVLQLSKAGDFAVPHGPRARRGPRRRAAYAVVTNCTCHFILCMCPLAGGTLKAFGAGVGQLTTPITSATGMKLVDTLQLPRDDRETEVLALTRPMLERLLPQCIPEETTITLKSCHILLYVLIWVYFDPCSARFSMRA